MSDENEAQAPPSRPHRKIARFLLTGLAILLPVFLTGWVVLIVVGFVNDVLGRTLGQWLAAAIGVPPTNVATTIAGAILAVVVAVAVAGLAGVLMGSLFGRRLIDAFQQLLLRVPLIRFIYPSVKQITDFFFGEKKLAFHSVVAIPFPAKGLYSVGFVTGHGLKSLNAATGDDLVHVFVPFAPAPVTGYVVFVPRRDIVELPMTVEEAFRFLVSAGVIVPPHELVQAVARREPLPAAPR